MASITTQQNVRVEDNSQLKVNFEGGEAVFDLNTVLGNNNGRFSWGDGGYLESAQEFRFSVEGDGIPVLRAQLRNADGEWVESDVNLDERIKFQDNQLVFV
ncbi:Cyanovirin-N [Halenospora varia]|nr:Cyanovirin-N [Halenospora varia]